MIRLSLESKIGTNHLSLPNGICRLSNGDIAVADGGLDKIVIFDSNGHLAGSIGRTGLGKYSFKEPVAIARDECGRIFVADWHNHRAVVFDEQLKYLYEFGHQSLIPPAGSIPSIRRMLRLFRSFFYGGTYMSKHFPPVANENKRKRLPLVNTWKAITHFYAAQSQALHYGMRHFRSMGFDKPNGFAFLKDQIWIAQKNSRCVVVHGSLHPHNVLCVLKEPIPGIEFGRLGNIAGGRFGGVYVCDEQNGAIWSFKERRATPLRLTGADSGVGQFLPFSCAEINERLVAVCGGLNVQIVDRLQNQAVYVSEPLGELHGILFDEPNSRLWIANRSEGNILQFAVHGL